MTNFTLNLHPSQKEIELNQTFADTHWGETDDDPNHIDFFESPHGLAQLFEGSLLVSSLALHSRHLNYQGENYLFAGIGGVVTHQGYRRRGLATQLLKDSFQAINTKYDFAMLCTDISRLSPLYSSVGFVPLGRPYYFLDKNGLKKPESGGMVAPLSSPKAVNLILNTLDEIFVGTSNF